MKHIMNEYLIIIETLTNVLHGRNLSETFAININAVTQTMNISKIKDICYGLLRNYYIEKNIIDYLVPKKVSEEKIFIVLLIAIYEIEYTKKPEFAITNELVSLSYTLTKDAKLKNFVNAVIRSYIRNKEQIKQRLSKNQEYKYNFPSWLINKLKQTYPKSYLNIIANSNQKPKISLRVNLSKITFSDYIKQLHNNSIEFELINNKIVLTHSLSVDNIPLFNQGYVSIQDISAQKLIDLIQLKNGEYILDACCAPGGKTCQILENYQVELVGLDIDATRLAKVQQNLTRLSLSAKLIHANAENLAWWDGGQFDTIIADVPCSASGTLKRNPDIKLHRQLADIANFVATQRKIVLNLWQTLKSGGTLVYITCSIFKEENQNNIQFFMQELKEIKLIKELTIFPTDSADGFYYCILQKLNQI